MLDKYLQILLEKHSCVIVPGFGAFLAHYKPAEVNLKENKIYPPSKSVAFNKTLQSNDGILANAIAETEKIGYNDALQKIAIEISFWENSILQNKSLLLKNIGRFIVDENRNLIFAPFDTKNYLAESFGLQAISMEPIKRLKDTVKPITENEIKKSKFSFSILNAMLAITVLTFIVLTTVVNVLQSGTEQVSLASLFPFSSSVPAIKQEHVALQPKKKEITAEPPKYVVVDNVSYPTAIAKEENETTVEISNQPATTQIASSAAMAKNSTGKTYVAIGAFFSEASTQDVVKKAESEGFTTKLYKDAKRYKVLIELNKSDLARKLPLIKSEVNANAWVYCSDCMIP